MKISLHSHLLSLLGIPCLFTSLVLAEEKGNWPQWRGPQREGISTETIPLLKQWPDNGPPVVWEVNSVGVGYSSLAISDGMIVTQGDLDGVEHIICLNESDGKLRWAVQPAPVAKALADRVESELKRLDKDADGKIDEAEALAGMGWNFNNFVNVPEKVSAEQAQTIAAARTQRLFKKLDKNSDGLLTFEEAGSGFRDVFSNVDTTTPGADAAALAKQRTAAYLKEADTNQDGKLSRQEARRTSLDRNFNRADDRDPATNKGDEQLTATEIEAYLAKSEAGCDGQISAAELTAFYVKQLPGQDGSLTSENLKRYYGGYRNGQGDGPRGTPTIEGNRVYVEGGNGDLTCLDLATGKTVWHVNLVQDLQGGRPGWGYSESPLIEGGLIIVTPGGKGGTLAALDKLNGNVVWRSDKAQESAHYSSPIVAEIAGIRQIVQFARNSVFGVSASSGELLWNYSSANNGTANCCTPVVFRDHVFATSSYGTGGGLAQIRREESGQSAKEVYFDKAMAVHHGGVVRVGDYLYGFGNSLMCLNFLTGETAWKARSVSKGSLTVADGMLYLLGERHEMALAVVTPEGYQETGRFKIENFGRPSWAHPVVAGGRLYLRNQHRLTAYDIVDKSK